MHIPNKHIYAYTKQTYRSIEYSKQNQIGQESSVHSLMYVNFEGKLTFLGILDFRSCS